MTQISLAQLLAIESGVRTKTDTEGAEIARRVQKEALTSGLAREFTPNDDSEDRRSEMTLVQVKVPESLDALSALMTRLFDVVLTKETANTEAGAPLIVNGVTLLLRVPVTFLLFLGHQLDELAAFIAKIPVLDPANRWTWDDNTGTYVTPEVETFMTRKTRVNHVLAPATKEHPAQVQVFNDDVTVGHWLSRKSSGAIFATRKQELVDRISDLRAAVALAREAANTRPVDDQHAGEVIFDWLFRTLPAA